MVAKYTRQGVDQAKQYGARLSFAFWKKIEVNDKQIGHNSL